MIKKIKRQLAIILTSIMFMVPALVPAASASAACNSVAQGIYSGVSYTGTSGNNGGTGGCGNGTTVQQGIKNIASKVINVFSIIVGVISVIMIIYAGFKYITSGSSSEGQTGARNTLMYAIIGLVITVSAQLIVHLVLNSASNINNQ